MFTRVSPRSEIFHEPVDVAAFPPPPPRTGSNGPTSRQHVAGSLHLNTSLGYVPGAVHLNTPIVPATPASLSSPFVLSHPTPTAHVAQGGSVPGTGSRGVSPVNNRTSGNFTMSYDPREWASGRRSVEARPQNRDCYGESLQTPPPAYTTTSERESTSVNVSRPVSSYGAYDMSSATSTPVVPDTTAPRDLPNHASLRPNLQNTASRQLMDLRRTSYIHSMGTQDYDPGSNQQQYRPQHPSTIAAASGSLSFQASSITSDTTKLPPPPPRRTPPNAPSESDAGSSLTRLSYTRRSTSAGPIATSGPSLTRSMRTMSTGEQVQTPERTVNVTLPGPPSAPPPPPRSRSATGDIEQNPEPTGSRQRPARLNIWNSNLAPIPATPASIGSSAQVRTGMFPLRIDTGMAAGSSRVPGGGSLALSEGVDLIRSPQRGLSTLARRSALRGPAARSSGTGPARNRSKSITGQSPLSPLDEPLSTTTSNNPWASALESARSPQSEGLPESAILPSMDRITFPSKNPMLKSHTPPVTPSSYPRKTTIEHNHALQQAKVLPTPPLSQKPLLSANSVTNSQQLDGAYENAGDDFVSQALRRHAEFLREEQEANTDLDRLQLFARYMQQESLIRKDRYLVAFQSAEFDAGSVRAMIFDGPKPRQASAGDNNLLRGPSPGSNTPRGRSSAQTSGSSLGRVDNAWSRDFHPQLSPIASMDYDEMSSRGRAPSRWWESAANSQSEGHVPGVHRSKRESKYMSLSKQLLQDMETGDINPVHEDLILPSDDPYPNEKTNLNSFGYYDEEGASPPLTQQSQRQAMRTSGLDISRFITLPPSYPRHYPAVNNNHPDLSEYRNTVRMLSDLSDAKNRHSRHQLSVEAMQQERRNKTAEIRRTFRANIQAQTADGSLSYAEAAEAEKMVKEEEHELERRGLQAEFDTLQDVVINPLHDQFNERIEQLSRNLQSLQEELVIIAANQDPDQPVQEGDDVPELLEQLTQLKWLFDARETLHQELFGLLSQRNNAYKAIVALPYRQTNNHDKVRDTEAFFDKDAVTRHATFCTDSMRRHADFLQFIEENALRGVELQSSAFWDITPGLVDLLQKIPTDGSRLQLYIPDEELKENPGYAQHPQQYLYLLLRHAEKSSYQYIEGQVNLHCLVHEVKTSSLAARYRASKAQRNMAGDADADSADNHREDEALLTQELKNRAAMIEEQWQDALGTHFHNVEQRVKQQLQEQDAWEDIVAED